MCHDNDISTCRERYYKNSWPFSRGKLQFELLLLASLSFSPLLNEGHKITYIWFLSRLSRSLIYPILKSIIVINEMVINHLYLPGEDVATVENALEKRKTSVNVWTRF